MSQNGNGFGYLHFLFFMQDKQMRHELITDTSSLTSLPSFGQMILPPKTQGFWHEKSCVQVKEATSRERCIWKALESRARQAPHAKIAGQPPHRQGVGQRFCRGTQNPYARRGGACRGTRLYDAHHRAQDIGLLRHDPNLPGNHPCCIRHKRDQSTRGSRAMRLA